MILRSKKSTVGSLSQESDEIFSIFTKIQERCNQLNQKISEVTIIKQQEVYKLNAEIHTLNGITKRNTNLSDKINQFLNN